jgi:hypothetical protein
MDTEQKIRHGLVWPVMLIGAGIVLLASNMGLLPWGVWQTLISLWPVLLIAAGLDLLLGRNSTWGALLAALLVLVVMVGAIYVGLNQTRTAGVYRTETINQALEGAKSAVIEFDHGTGLLSLSAQTEATGNLIEGSLQLSPGERVTTGFHKSGDTAYYDLKSHNAWNMPFANLSWPWSGGLTTEGPWSGDKAWNVSLSRDIPVRLRISTGAGRSVLDLAQLNIPELSVKGGVGQVELTVPQRGQSKVTIDGGIGEVIVRIPQGIGARIQVEGGIGGATADGRFEKSEDTYTTPGYASATDRCEVWIKGGIGAATIREVQLE